MAWIASGSHVACPGAGHQDTVPRVSQASSCNEIREPGWRKQQQLEI
nr:hypothetical protein [Candidatus Sigynarchaeum springense]